MLTKRQISIGIYTLFALAVAGGVFFWVLVVSAATPIATCTELQNIKNALGGDYILTQNVDCSASNGWNGGLGFEPIGTIGDPFTGTLDGAGYTISGLEISRPATSSVGMIGYTFGGTVKNVTLSSFYITGSSQVAAAVGYSSSGFVRNVAVQNTTVNGEDDIGLVVGNNIGLVEKSQAYTIVDLNSTGVSAGGLVGENAGTVKDSYADVSVTANSNGGGLVGYNQGGTIENSYAIGSVSNAVTGGGLVGLNEGTILHSFAIGSVDGFGVAGGLVGNNTSGQIQNSYWLNHGGNPDSCYNGGDTGCTVIHGSLEYFYNTAQGPMRNWDFPSVWSSTVNDFPKLRWKNGGMAGAGTSVSPYQITNCAQLQEMIHVLTGSYLVMNDIDCNVSPYSSGSGFYAIGTGSALGNFFKGTLNGSGAVIERLMIDRRSTHNIGLIGYGSGSLVTKLGLSGATVTGRNDTGILMGNNFAGTITQSYTTGTSSGALRTGGLVGTNGSNNSHGFISDAYSTATVFGAGYVGGFVGWQESNEAVDASYIRNAYAVGNVITAGTDAGGFAGYQQDSTIRNAFAVGIVSGDGLNEGTFISTTDFSVLTNTFANRLPGETAGCFFVGSGVAQCSNIHNNAQYFYNTANAPMRSWDLPAVWSTVNATYPKLRWEGFGIQGQGSVVDPYQVSNCAQLQETVHTLTGSFLQTQNIDCNVSPYNTGSGFFMVGTGSLGNAFSGRYNGTGYNIERLTINRRADSNVGLFGMSSGKITNVTISGATITGNTFVGTLVGQMSGTASGATMIETTVNASSSAGGVVGILTGSVYTSTSSGSINTTSTTSNAGGLVGAILINSPMTVSGSSAIGLVHGKSTVGGLIGSFDASKGKVVNSQANVYAEGTTAVGGLIGSVPNGLVQYSRALGTASGSSNVGGLAGTNTIGGAIYNSYATGTATGATSIGGLIGYNYGAASGSYAVGNVFGTTNVGGFIGQNDVGNSVRNSYASGTVRGTNRIGGFIGYSISGAVYMENVYATGNVYGSTNVGGLIGENVSIFSFAYATGHVSGTTDVGGLVGESSSLGVGYTFATGRVSGSSNVGGLVGNLSAGNVITSTWLDHSGDSATNCYSAGNTNCTSITDVNLLYTKSTTPMPNWDFSTIWMDRDVGFPKLRHQFRDISTCTQLQNMNLTGSYILTQNVDCSATSGWNSGQGFNPLGDNVNLYRGDILGAGYTITGLRINRPAEFYVGLLGAASGGVVTNLHLQNVGMSGSSILGGLLGQGTVSVSGATVTGTVYGANCGTASVGGCAGLVGLNYKGGKIYYSHSQANVRGAGDYFGYVGGLVGHQYEGDVLVEHSSATGTVLGTDRVGGLIGYLNTGTASGVYATGNVTGSGNYVGGLIGLSNGSVKNAHALGTASGSAYVGGLIGQLTGTATGSYATGHVWARTNGGGLVGNLAAGKLYDTYATGDVYGSDYIGGLVGDITSTAEVIRAYATGDVSAYGGMVGGIAGGLAGSASITNSFSTSVIAGSVSGGGVGDKLGTLTNLYWYDQAEDSATQCYSGGNTGCTRVTSIAHFFNNANAPQSSWDFTTVWRDHQCHLPLFKRQSALTEYCISGTVFQSNGIGTLSGVTVAGSFNGGSKNSITAETDAGGQYVLAPSVSLTGGTLMTLFLDDETHDAATVTLGSGATMTGMHLYQDTLVTRSDSGSTVLTTAHLAIADNSREFDILRVFEVIGNSLFVKHRNHLKVWNNDAFTSSGEVFVGSGITLDGTLSLGTYTGSLVGNWELSSGGTFNKGTSTINLIGSGQTLSGATMFHNLKKVSKEQVSVAVDGDPNTGAYSSLAIGSDGFPVISYYDDTTDDLKLAHCGDAECRPTNRTTVWLDTTGVSGWLTSIAVPPDGLPVIVYGDQSNFDLQLIKCGNVLCTSGNTTTVIDAGVTFGASATAVAIGSDGLPIISYRKANPSYDLNVIKCGNAACSSGNTKTTLETTGFVAQDSSIAIGSDGLAIISYTGDGDDLKIAKCSNLACSSATITNADSSGSVGTDNAITVAPDGLPIIAYFDTTNSSLKILKCGNAACSSGNTTTTADNTAHVGEKPSIAVSDDGLPVISYFDSTNVYLKILKCGNTACSSGNVITLVTPGSVATKDSSISIAPDGLPVVSYSYNSNLYVLKCANNSCSQTSQPGRLVLPSETLQSVSGSLILRGTGTSLLALRASDEGIAALLRLDEAGTQTIDHLDVQDNDATGGQELVCSMGAEMCVDSENNTNWLFADDIITGTLYSDEGITALAGKVVSVSFDGGAKSGSGVTDAGGQFIISPVSFEPDSVVTLFVDNETEKAVTVVLGSGSSMSGMNLYQDRLIIRSETDTSVTNAHLDTGDNSLDADITSLYSATGSQLSVSDDKDLYIWSGDTFAPGGAVAADDVKIVGTYAAGSNVHTVSGSLIKNGTFTAGTSTVRLNGMNQTLSGSLSFFNFEKTVSATDTLTFGAGNTYVVASGALLQGATNNRLSLRSSQPNTQWNFNPQGNRTIGHVDVQDSNNANAAEIICLTNCIDSGNNINWNFGTTRIVGTLYSDEGITPLPAKHIALSVDGAALSATALTNSGGTFTMSGLNITNGSMLTLFVNDETENAVTVTFSSGSTMSGMSLFQNTLIARNDNNTSALTNTTFASADDSADSDIASVYTMAGNQMTVLPGNDFLIWEGDSFSQNDTVAVENLKIRGTYAATNSTLTVSGTIEKNGTFSAGTSTVILNGTNQTLSGSLTFFNLQKTVASADTLTFSAGNTFMVSSGVVLQGANTNNRLSLRSSVSGTEWNFNPSGARTLQFVDVQDSINLNSAPIDCTSTCTDSGNNTNWVFVALSGVTAQEADGVYGSGQTITIRAMFPRAVTVTGTPQIQLETGATDRFATYSGGSGNDSILFTYLVHLGDATSDLDYVSSGSLVLNGGTMKDSNGNDVRIRLPAPGATDSLGAYKNIVIGSCGDATLDAGEQCDDSNFASSDGCSSSCQIETGYTCDGTPSVCLTTCGDGIPAGSETCDDGAEITGDGCSDICLVETGYECSGTPSSCSVICGDGVLISPEVCDDGNNSNNDVCTNMCVPNVCGDTYVREGVEQCDDGNTSSGDGCSAACAVESGGAGTGTPYVPPPQGSSSSRSSSPPPQQSITDQSYPGTLKKEFFRINSCGNGLLETKAGEECDDGAFNGTARCSEFCTIHVCGDGILTKARGEECDDGNAVSNDGCSSTCKPDIKIIKSSSSASSVSNMTLILPPAFSSSSKSSASSFSASQSSTSSIPPLQ